MTASCLDTAPYAFWLSVDEHLNKSLDYPFTHTITESKPFAEHVTTATPFDIGSRLNWPDVLDIRYCGLAYIIAELDPDGVVEEVDEDNNMKASAIKIEHEDCDGGNLFCLINCSYRP